MATPKYAVLDQPVPPAELLKTLADGTKVMRRIPRMRASGEKLTRGNFAKRWFLFGEEIKTAFGANAEVYRC